MQTQHSSYNTNTNKEHRNLARCPEISAKPPKLQYDRSHRLMYYQVGGLVLRCHYVLSDAREEFAASLARKCFRPYRITRMLPDLVYQLPNPQLKKTIGPVDVHGMKSYTIRVVKNTSAEPSGALTPQS